MLKRGSGRAVALLTGVPSSRSTPCQACLRALALVSFGDERLYSTYRTSRPKSRSKKVFPSEFAPSPSVEIDPRRQRPSALTSDLNEDKEARITDADLHSAFVNVFQPPSSSTSSSSLRLDPEKVIDTVYPIIFRRKLRDVLNPHLRQIASSLSLNTAGGRNQNEERQRRILTILSHCYFRSAIATSQTQDSYDLADIYASFLIRESRRNADAASKLGLLQSLRSTLDRILASTTGYKLPPSIAAAWAVLGSTLKSQSLISDQTFNLPAGLDLTSLNRTGIEDFLSKISESLEDYQESITLLLARAKVTAPPSTSRAIVKDDLLAKITFLRTKGDMASIIALWETARSSVSQSKSKLDESTTLDEGVLAAFLRAFKRPTSRSGISSEQLDKYAQQVLSASPRPLPRAIASALLALRVRPATESNTSLQIGDQVRSLDSHRQTQSSSETLESLHAAWIASGDKDIKMYMMYMEGLGLFGDLPGLQKAWNELVRDEKCRQLYFVEDADASTSFPPTHALNHMISAAFLVPTTGPTVALDLFAQASRPDSTIPINLITINTVLRHHARQADLIGMNSLFDLAERLRLQPDVVTYTTLLQGLLRAGQLDMAKRALESMHLQGISPNERTCSMLIADLAKGGDKAGLKHAEELLRLMRAMGLKTNEVTWTGLIAGYFKGGWEEDGWDAVQRMEKAGLELNRIGYNVLIRQEAGSGNGVGMKIWEKMLENGIKPNSDTYLLLLQPLVKNHRWEEADKIIGYMGKVGFRPDKAALARLVESVRRRR